MTLMAYSPFGISETLSEQYPLTICLENPAHFRKFVKDLSCFCNCTTEEFAFLDEDGNRNFSPSEIQIVSNPASVDFNSRRASAAVLKEAKQACQIYESDTAEFLSAFERFSESILQHFPYLSLVSDLEGGINSFLKHCGFRFDSALLSADGEPEILEWIRISSQLLHDRLIVLINPSSFFSFEELDEVVKTAVGNQMCLLFIENFESKVYLKGNVLIVDSDLCLIEKSKMK